MARIHHKAADVRSAGARSEVHPFARSQCGYTLYELLFVATLIGLMAIVLMPAEEPVDELKIDFTAAEIASALRFARSEALRTGLPHGVSLDTKNNGLRVFSLLNRSTPLAPVFDVYHPVEQKPYARKFGDMPFEYTGEMVSNGTFRKDCDLDDHLVFDEHGTPWCPDPDEALAERFDVILSAGNQKRAVSVSGITGRVSIQ